MCINFSVILSYVSCKCFNLQAVRTPLYVNLQGNMMLGVVLLVVGLAGVVNSVEVPEICNAPISDPQPISSDQFHLNLQVLTGSFLKNTLYGGKLFGCML